MKQIYEVLSARRAELRMTLEELSQRSGVARSSIARIMSGETPDPQYQKLQAIVRALNMTMDEFSVRLNEQPVRQIPRQPMYSATERALIKKYRTLDEYGQRVVTSVMDIEYERCTAFDPSAEYAAAHEQDGQSMDDMNDAGRY